MFKCPLLLILYQHQAINGMFRTQKTILFPEMQVSGNEKLPAKLGKNGTLIAALQVEIDDLDESSFII